MVECLNVSPNQQAFDILERFLIEAIPERKNLPIGFIEDIQNTSSWEPFGARAFLPFFEKSNPE